MKFIFLFFLFPLKLIAQDITGVWTGTMYNDTTKQFIKYELAISEYNGKLSGYSHTIFVIDSVENIGVKSILIKKFEERYVIEDDKLIYNNYPEPPAKHVKKFMSLVLSQNDSSMMLSGPWKTNITRIYKSITGTISLQKKKETKQTLIIQKLQELGLCRSLSFMPQQTATENFTKTSIPVTLKTQPGEKLTPKNKEALNKEETNILADKNVIQNKREESILKREKVKEGNLETKTITQDNKGDSSIQKNTKALAFETASPGRQSKKQKQSSTVIFKNEEVIIKQKQKAAAEIATRKIETVKSVDIKSDSLTLTLYDNGEIDGDTVSVLLNGEIIMPLQGLTANGISKTLYLTPAMGDSLVLIMYAENLGSIPPNTGLLVVHDGEDVYEIRFTGDLTKNSAIILRRKKVK